MGNILISCAGKRVSLKKAFEEELKKYFPDNSVYTSDNNTQLSAACQMSSGSIKLPKLDSDNYLEELIASCQARSIKLIIPTIDTELILLSENKSRLISEGIMPLVSSIDFIKKCRDKRKIHKFLSSVGIKVAKEFSKSNYQLPLFIKPIDGSRSLDNFIIKNEKDFLDRHFKNERLMFLEYFEPQHYKEYTCDMYYNIEGELCSVVVRERIDVRDGEVKIARTEKNSIISLLKDKLSVIEGVSGCITSQFFKNKNSDEIIAIEINPRFGGGFPLAYKAGANFPKWIIEEYFLNESIEPDYGWEENLLMIRYDKEIFINSYNV